MREKLFSNKFFSHYKWIIAFIIFASSVAYCATVMKDLTIQTDLTVRNDASILNDAFVTNDLTVSNNIIVTGTVDGRDIATDGSTLDTLNTNLGGITLAESQQVQNINAQTISNSQWTFLSQLDQALDSTASPTFGGMTLNGSFTIADGSEGSSGDIWTSTGVGGLGTWAPLPAGGATTALDNLAAVAINTDLDPDATANLRDFGASSAYFNQIHHQQGVYFNGGDTTLRMFISGKSGTLPDTTSINARVFSFSDGILGLYTSNNTNADAQATGDLRIQTGNKTSGGSTGDTGSIGLRPGTVSGSGTRGTINFTDGSEGVTGECWISSNTGGQGNWDTCPGTGSANNQLSNLGATAVNADIDPDLSGTRSLGGGATSRWLTVHSSGHIAYSGSIEMKTSAGGLRARLTETTLPSGATNIHTWDAVDAANGVGLTTSNHTGADANDSNTVYIESGNVTNAGASGDSGPINLTTGTNAGSGVRGKINADSNLLAVTSGISVVKVVADPCGDTVAFPESTLFYNDTSDYYCFCDGAGVDQQMHAPTTACF
jgi:hypothetical protein